MFSFRDADSSNVQQRGEEEKFGHGIQSRCRLALMHYRPLVGVPGIEVRHVRRSRAGSMFDTYAHSFDAVWATATPVREG